MADQQNTSLIPNAGSDWQHNVDKFHQKFGFPRSWIPKLVDEAQVDIRLKVMGEEYYDELIPAMKRGDLVEIADALGDLIYTVIGTARVYGIDLHPIMMAIHISNMLKEPDPDSFKPMKPEGWRPPDLHAELMLQGWEGDDDGTPPDWEGPEEYDPNEFPDEDPSKGTIMEGYEEG